MGPNISPSLEIAQQDRLLFQRTEKGLCQSDSSLKFLYLQISAMFNS